MITQKHIANRIRILREIRGDSQEACSQRVSFGRGKWSAIEGNRHTLTWPEMEEVCKSLDFDIAYLAGPMDAFAEKAKDYLILHAWLKKGGE